MGPRGRPLGLCLSTEVWSAARNYLRRQLLEHLSLLTPTSAAARQSTRVGDAVMKALGSPGGHYPSLACVTVDVRNQLGFLN